MATLLLVEDHTLFRAGIRALIERSACAHKIVGEAADGLAAIRQVRDLLPDILLMDVSMPRLNGIETARQLHKEFPSMSIVMLSMHADPEYIFAALDAGASAYILKDAAFAELEAALRAVLAGDKYLSAGVRSAVQAGRGTEGPVAPLVTSLSPRERQILQLVGEAFSNAEIASELSLSIRTVETYRQNMMNKLNLHSVAALTAFAIRHGICSQEAASHPDSSGAA